ncbi:MAG: LTA synthase family protein [Anaerovoracaceae bacterium]
MEEIKRFYERYLHNGLIPCVIMAFVLNMIIESVGRGSLVEGLSFLINHPKVFFYNALIIFCSLSITLLFRRRIFVFVIITSLWLALGITNGVILGFRMTPFTVSDLALLENGLSILPNYMNTLEIIFALVGAIAIITILSLIFIFAPKWKRKIMYKTNIAIILVSFVALGSFTALGMNNHWLSTYFGNLGYAYKDYGVPYCFLNTWLNRGIRMPKNYSEEAVIDVFKGGLPMGIEEANEAIPVIHTAGDTKKEHLPNIIVLQLESYIDPVRIKGLEFSQNPVPIFTALKEKHSTGLLRVPSVGAGTANTEFEVLTGMRVKNFGPGEYPYKTVLKENTCESINYTLKKFGYTCHAIHNHRGVFYGRNQVFSNLGFDTFTSLEYMNDIKRTKTNWAKDYMLTDEIITAMKSTPGRDMVFTISVQGHGKYPTDSVIPDDKLAVQVTGPDDEGELNAIKYFVQQMYEMDEFLGELIQELTNFDEEVILVAYGDHLPVLNIHEDSLKTGTLYDTEYVIWSNFGLGKIDGDISSFQLSAKVLERVGINSGVLTWYHQTREDNPKYLDNLRLLQYDMLYGNNYVFGEKKPYEPTRIKMGIRPIRVTEIFAFGSNTYVRGENFTRYSKVAFDGNMKKTIFVNPQVLKVPEKLKTTDISRFTINQVEKYKEILSTFEAVIQPLEDVE